MDWARSAASAVIPLDAMEPYLSDISKLAYGGAQVYHFKDVDKQYSQLSGKEVDKSILEDVAKGADYSALIYDLEKLCDNLDENTEFIVLSKETKIRTSLNDDPDQPDGKLHIYIYNFIIINIFKL